MSGVPTDPKAMLTRDRTAAALTNAGFPVTSSTLATKATRGGGPPYKLFGRKPLYTWSDALEWAEGRLSKTLRSTSELEARTRARAPPESNKNVSREPFVRLRLRTADRPLNAINRHSARKAPAFLGERSRFV
jgi:hypothetical protein